MTTTRIGRPPKPAQEDDGRRHFGVQMPLHLRAQLEAAAETNHRSLSAELLARLEASFRDDFTEAQRHAGRRLIGHYLVDGPAAVVKLVTKMPDPVTGEPPDEAESKRRWQVMVDTLQEARWSSPEAEDRWQRLERRLDELRAMFLARAEAAAKPEDEAA
jgi:hypothetical protein